MKVFKLQFFLDGEPYYFPIYQPAPTPQEAITQFFISDNSSSLTFRKILRPTILGKKLTCVTSDEGTF